MNFKDKALWKYMCQKTWMRIQNNLSPIVWSAFFQSDRYVKLRLSETPKVLCPLWLWKNGKSMPTPITRAWNFLKRCADARVCITSHRYAYGVNIMTAFWIPVFNMPTFSSNKSQPSFKLGLLFICNIEIMSSIFLEPIQESEWKVTFDSFLNIIILHFFFIRILWFHQSTISLMFDKCSMLQETQSRPNHTSNKNFHFNEFVANALHDNIRSTKTASNLRKKMRPFFVIKIKNLGSG